MATQFTEGQRLQGSDGNVYVVRNGMPVREDAAAPQRQTFGTPDPYAAPKAGADAARAQAEAARAQAEAPYAAQTAQAQARKASAEAEKAQRDLAAQQATASPGQQKAMADLSNDEVLTAINNARGKLNAGYSAGYWARLGKVPLVGGLVEPQNAVDLEGALNTIASRLTLDKLAQLKQASPTGASGLGSLTEREGALLRDSVAALGQTQSPKVLEDNLAAVEKHYRNIMALSKGEDYRDPKVAERYGIAAAPTGDNQQKTFATGANREEPDPALAGVNNRIRSMIGSGASADDIVKFMNQVRPGLGDQRSGDVSAAVRFRGQNPSVPLDRYTISVENRAVPMSSTRQFLNNAAQTPGGTFLMNAGDAISGGTLDNLTDNPALARAGMSALAEQNPISAIAGMVGGGALASAGVERAVSGLGRLAPLAADAIYGGAYGAGSADEGNRLSGALGGASMGVAGGTIGRRAAGMFGRGLRGVQNEDAQLLRDRGIPLTIGQIRGGAAKAREDRLAGFGGIGDRINTQRLQGIEGFNRAAFDEGFSPVSAPPFAQTGEQAVSAGRGLVSGPGGAYDQALNGVSLVPDAQFATDVGGALASGKTLPRVGPEFEAFVNRSIAPHFNAPNGQISGRQMQDVIQQIRGADFGTDSMGSMASDAARGIEGAVSDLAGRQAPDVMPALGNANTAYRNLNILSDAVRRGINNDGMFTPAQLGMAARENTTRFGGKIASATPKRPFYELQRAGQNVLPSRIPDSGTAGRAEAGRGIAGSLRSAARTAVNGPLYSEALQPYIASLLLDRPQVARDIGERALRNNGVLGMFGRPAALAYDPLGLVGEPY